MIELIFALVIIGIVLMSAPLLIKQSAQSNIIALQQESIAAIAAHTNILLTKHWDEADANLSGGRAPILTTSSGDVIFDFDNNLTRQGLYLGSGRLTDYLSNRLPASDPLQSDGNDRDDIDDYNGLTNIIRLYANQVSNSITGDYIDTQLNILTNVAYVNDTPTSFSVNSIANDIDFTAIGGTSNIKFVNVVLTSNSGIDELQKNIILNAFSCNLGTTIMNGDDY